ncbi:PTS sugar transporter subunit IIA [Lactobacillus kefiranofaciens]|uniref:PTS sugar transporter subunit IIA n=1 Tax=Lactobacillus kefiranofaciens TaxID=267818 RepID=A0AAX3UGL2_9LACO|nr:PTS sugar transporter subunit IIA [Lactobacillus kefiranofaciens]AEG39802.1 Phosphoenolpyruvate-dependent sugar PTS family porter EIIA, mannose specific [Lactobacillus kefiranofaciens subsp. kefiranofaciens]KRM22980.1 phosphoenolpyruvate-dependent sugar PTS family porter EIIA, mannose specific [Lactobacillus kefiranofaciens subsp. kefiranofaciens DSM 5016 = JCM 6985]MDF4141547.1 PTS sugar transporter subunit IIA [Lactobacillus kefiranofaciens]QFQ67412.1 PTS sugar transporter subunit IIA [Lac
MKYLIMVSHGRFAEGVKTSLEMFAGDANDRVFALCLHNGKSADDFKKEVETFLDQHDFKESDEFIVLADIIGGSPLTTFLNVFSARGYMDRAVVLGGMNFTMALTATVSLDNMDKETIAQTALNEAKTAVQQYEIPSSTDNDDDNDI